MRLIIERNEPDNLSILYRQLSVRPLIFRAAQRNFTFPAHTLRCKCVLRVQPAPTLFRLFLHVTHKHTYTQLYVFCGVFHVQATPEHGI